MPLPWANAFPILAARLVSEFRGDYNAMLDAMLRCFTGPEEPPQRFPGMLWVDTSVTPRLLKQRKSDDTGWVIRARIDTDYGGVLPLGGGTMEGAINMNGFGVTNLPLGSGNSPARYADLAAYAKIDGSTAFTAYPSLPSGSDPSLAAHAAKKSYVDAKAVAGGSFVGQIAMTVAPTAADHVMRKSDVENLIGTHAHTAAAGQGVKLTVASLSSAGQQALRIMESDGAGGVAWTSRVRQKLLDQPQVITLDTKADVYIGSSSNGTWKTVDLTGLIVAGATGAILQILFGASQGGVSKAKVHVRKTGTSFTTSQAPHIDASVGTVNDQQYGTFSNGKSDFIVALDSSYRFDIALIPNVGNLADFRMSLWVIGEF